MEQGLSTAFSTVSLAHPPTLNAHIRNKRTHAGSRRLRDHEIGGNGTAMAHINPSYTSSDGKGFHLDLHGLNKGGSGMGEGVRLGSGSELQFSGRTEYGAYTDRGRPGSARGMNDLAPSEQSMHKASSHPKVPSLSLNSVSISVDAGTGRMMHSPSRGMLSMQGMTPRGSQPAEMMGPQASSRRVWGVPYWLVLCRAQVYMQQTREHDCWASRPSNPLACVCVFVCRGVGLGP